MPVPKILNLGYEEVDPKTLNKFPNNPWKGDSAEVAKSIKENGFWGALIVQKDTRTILAGNHRVDGAIMAGMERVPVMWVDVSEERQIKINLADNRYAENGEYDKNLQLEQLDKLDDIFGTGYDQDEVDEIRALVDSDDPEVPTEDGEDMEGWEPDQDRYQNQYAVMVICQTEESQEEIYDRLTGQGYECRVVTT